MGRTPVTLYLCYTINMKRIGTLFRVGFTHLPISLDDLGFDCLFVCLERKSSVFYSWDMRLWHFQIHDYRPVQMTQGF